MRRFSASHVRTGEPQSFLDFSGQCVLECFRVRAETLAVRIRRVPRTQHAKGDFGGREVSEKRYAQSLRVNATPTLLFFDLEGKEIARVVGPVKDVAEFLLLGQFISSGAYRSSKFAEYREQARRKPRGG